MTNTIQVKRRSYTAAAGAPSALLEGEIAYNEADHSFWIGENNGTTVSPVSIGGRGAFFDLSTSQTVNTGTKTFASGSAIDASGAGYVKVPTSGSLLNDSTAASTAYVRSFFQPLSSLLASIASVGTGILVNNAGSAAVIALAVASTARLTIANANGTAGNPTFDLATSGVAAGTYTKLSVDAYGRATAGASLALADLPAGVALTAASTTFTDGLFSTVTPASASNDTSVATTQWVRNAGLTLRPTITTYTATPQTLGAAVVGGIVIWNGTSAGAFTLPAADSVGVIGPALVISNTSAYTLTIYMGGLGPDTNDEGGTITLQSGERIALATDNVSSWKTLWRVNYSNPNFTGNVTIAGTLKVGTSAGFQVAADGTTTVKSLTITGTVPQNSFLAGSATGTTAPSFRPLAPADLPIGSATRVGGLSVNTSAGLTVTAGGQLSAAVWSVSNRTGAVTTANLVTDLTPSFATLAGSPVFTGTPQAPTANNGTNTTQLATTAYVLQVHLNQFVAPTAALNLNSQKITNLLDPTNPQDAATKNYVDMNLQGFNPKPTAQFATLSALPASYTYNNGASGVGATITAATGSTTALVLDGQAVSVNQVVLIMGETGANAAHNGLYTVTNAGGTAQWVLTRSTEMNSSTSFNGGYVVVESGNTLAKSIWLCNVGLNPTIGTTAITFVQINGAADLIQGNGISIAGNTVSAVVVAGGGLSVSGSGLSITSLPGGVQTSITSLGTITTGTWHGTAIGAAYGGLGVNAASASGYAKWSAGTPSWSAQIPFADVVGLQSMAQQAANNVAITGGSINGITIDGGSF